MLVQDHFLRHALVDVLNVAGDRIPQSHLKSQRDYNIENAR